MHPARLAAPLLEALADLDSEIADELGFRMRLASPSPVGDERVRRLQEHRETILRALSELIPAPTGAD